MDKVPQIKLLRLNIEKLEKLLDDLIDNVEKIDKIISENNADS